jgi:hypothetical protein
VISLWLVLEGMTRVALDNFISELAEAQREREQKQVGEFWQGHSLFQVPHRVVAFKGESEALVLIYFYERAAAVSFYSEKEVLIEIKVKEETVAERTGLSMRSVSYAIATLEAAGCIRVVRPKPDAVTGRKSINAYLLLHGETKDPLVSQPKVFGVCHANFEKPYITVHKEIIKTVRQMTKPGRACYLAALSVASLKLRTSFGITREQWKTETLLGKNAFNIGVKECKSKKLLAYKRGVLTLHDPLTGKISERVRGRVEHENPQWKFDLNSVSAEVWRAAIERLVKHPFIVGSTGWTHSTRETYCPFCHEVRSFRVNFSTAEFKCYACQRHGRLGKLVQKLLGTASMGKAKEFIQEQMARCKPNVGKDEGKAVAHDVS